MTIGKGHVTTPSMASAPPIVDEAGPVKTSEVKEAASVMPAIGTPAPSSPPPTALDAAYINNLIAQRVNEEVTERLKALEDDDPNKKQFIDEDQQFANFDKRLEVFGVDLATVLPDFRLRWFNDSGDRIVRMQVMGWAFVKRTEVALNEKFTPLNQDLGDNIAVYVGRNPADGSPMRAFLMKIPQALNEKRYGHQQAHNDKIEQAIAQGSIGNALQQGGYPGTDMGQVQIRYKPR